MNTREKNMTPTRKCVVQRSIQTWFLGENFRFDSKMQDQISRADARIFAAGLYAVESIPSWNLIAQPDTETQKKANFLFRFENAESRENRGRRKFKRRPLHACICCACCKVHNCSKLLHNPTSKHKPLAELDRVWIQRWVRLDRLRTTPCQGRVNALSDPLYCNNWWHIKASEMTVMQNNLSDN